MLTDVSKMLAAVQYSSTESSWMEISNIFRFWRSHFLYTQLPSQSRLSKTESNMGNHWWRLNCPIYALKHFRDMFKFNEKVAVKKPGDGVPQNWFCAQVILWYIKNLYFVSRLCILWRESFYSFTHVLCTHTVYRKTFLVVKMKNAFVSQWSEVEMNT